MVVVVVVIIGLFVGNGLSIECAGHQIGGGGQCIRGGARCRCRQLIVGVVVQAGSRVR